MIKKPKFELTSDLVKIEPEPNTYRIDEPNIDCSDRIYEQEKDSKEQFNLKISKHLKNNFQIWCINENISMTEGLEIAINNVLKK